MRALRIFIHVTTLGLMPLLCGACTTLFVEGPERPETILRRTYANTSPAAVVSALQQAAFDVGYTPSYARTDEGFYAYELFDRNLLAPDRLRRLEALVVRDEHGTALQLRIHSVDADDGTRYGVQKEDRTFARDLIAALDDVLPLRSTR